MKLKIGKRAYHLRLRFWFVLLFATIIVVSSVVMCLANVGDGYTAWKGPKNIKGIPQTLHTKEKPDERVDKEADESQKGEAPNAEVAAQGSQGMSFGLTFGEESRVKPYMDFRCVTSPESEQWKLLHGENCVSVGNGLMSVDGYYCVAMGQNFGSIGDRFIATLEKDNGERYEVGLIMADAKQMCHTRNCEGWVGVNGHVFEMVVDTDILNPTAKVMGDCNYVPELEGKVVEIRKL
jgi:hypothetical protein